jgi:hypothetical protein
MSIGELILYTSEAADAECREPLAAGAPSELAELEKIADAAKSVNRRGQR